MQLQFSVLNNVSFIYSNQNNSKKNDNDVMKKVKREKFDYVLISTSYNSLENESSEVNAL